jgi:hypothetical protein
MAKPPKLDRMLSGQLGGVLDRAMRRLRHMDDVTAALIAVSAPHFNSLFTIVIRLDSIVTRSRVHFAGS